jgi:hypothetical protein
MKLTMFAFAAVVLTAGVAGAQQRVVEMKETRISPTHRVVERVETWRGEPVEDAPQLARTRIPLEGKVVQGAPYSAEVITEHIQVLADGNRIVRRTTGRVYRDGQGRIRREEDKAPGQVDFITINDPVANVAYSLNPTSRTGMKTTAAAGFAGRVVDWKVAVTPKVDPAEMERRKAVEAEIAATKAVGGGRGGGFGGAVAAKIAEAAWEEKTEKLPARNIEGVMAEGTRTTRTIPMGAIGNEQPIVIVSEEWRSPELQVLVMTRNADPRTGESVYKLANITRAEPNASWFEVPSDYTVKEYTVKLAPARK